MMDHLTRFTVLTPIPNKSAVNVAQAIIDRFIGIFGSPEMLDFDQSPEFQNSVVDSTATFHTTGV